VVEFLIFAHCDSDSSGTKQGRGRREKASHKDLEDLKALAFHSSGRAFFAVLEVFVVRFSRRCLNRDLINPRG